MAIVNDQARERVVDTETGEYMTWKLADWQTQSSYFVLHDKDENGVLGALVSVSGKYDNPEQTAATLEFSLEKSWIPTGKEGAPVYFYDAHPLISRLSSFLKVYRHYSGVKSPDPRFEFVDARGGRK